MLLHICSIYLLIFTLNPILIKTFTSIQPFELTRGYFNIQAFNDLSHLALISLMLLLKNEIVVSQAVVVYFCFDLLFHFKLIFINTAFLLHHLSGCFQIYMMHMYFSHRALQTLTFFLWIQETALIPISIIDIFKIQRRTIPVSLLITRALWYLSTRLYTYGFFLYNHSHTFHAISKVTALFFCTPLILHNIYCFKRQMQAIVARPNHTTTFEKKETRKINV